MPKLQCGSGVLFSNLMRGLILSLFFAGVGLCGSKAKSNPFAADKETRNADVKGESFESALVPDNWKAIGSSDISLSTKHFKHGEKSLKWQWKGKAKLSVQNVKPLQGKKVGAIRAWVYSEKPYDAKLKFRFGDGKSFRQGKAKYEFDFGLNFKGWRAMWVDLRNDVDENPSLKKVNVDQMQIIAPEAAKEGVLFFDIIEFGEKPPGKRSNDFQVPFVNQKSDGHWQQTYRWGIQKPIDPVPEKVTQEEKAAFKTIYKRYCDWILGDNVDLNDPLMKPRCDKLKAYIQKGVRGFDKFKIKRDGDTITGVGLFASVSSYGPKFSRHAIADCMMPLVLDYKINANAKSKDKLIDLFDYLNDQGWAAGSAAGSLDHELNRSSSYMHAVVLMKDELEEAGILEREFAAMRWYTEIGEIYGKPHAVGTTADRVISHLPYRLLSILAMPDSVEKVRDMRCLIRWMDNCFDITPGWAGLIKPDYLAFHHKAHYGGAYGTPALQSAALLNYFLHGTTFALSKASTNNIKQGLLTARVFANKYDVPIGVAGRFPFTNPVAAVNMPGFAYMALSGDPVDEEMARVFMRLWDPDSAIVQKALIGNLTSRDSYSNTVGSLGLLQKLADMNYKPEKAPVGHWSKNYGALAIHRRDDWMVSVKGHSKYVWDYEGHYKKSGPENIYGRYLAYGAMQILGSGDPVTDEDSGYVQDGWDWSRWPGTTVKRLSLDELNFNKARNFTDRPFVGGLTSNGTDGIFVLDFHDATFDKSFTARKSYFFVDDLVVCIGSGISNGDAKHDTETILFQNYLKDADMAIMADSDKKIKSIPFSRQFKGGAAWLIDAFGNGYYLPASKGLEVCRSVQKSRNNTGKKETSGKFAVAYINHGKSPKAASYEYAVKVKASADEMVKFASKPAYNVVSRSNAFHAVEFPAKNLAGYAIYDDSGYRPIGVLKSVNRPCVVMIEQQGKQARLSVCDPDLRLMEKAVAGSGKISADMMHNQSKPAKLIVTLKGKWKVKDSGSDFKTVDAGQLDTAVEVYCRDGFSYEVNLVADDA